MRQSIQLKINGRSQQLEVEPWQTLLDVLRDKLGLTGVRRGCETSYCGNCSVLLDGLVAHSCCTLAVAAQGKEIITVEGLTQDGNLHPLQQSFVEHGAIQCGYCTPGMILAGKALLDSNPRPTEEEVRRGLVGNLCRCTGYQKIVDAVLAVGAANAEGGAQL